MQLAPPTGVTARYQGSITGTSQFWYWIQALYPEGYSILSAFATTGNKCPASFSQANFVNVQWNSVPGAIGYLVWKTSSSTAPASGNILGFVATSETGVKDDGVLVPATAFSATVRYDSLYVWKALYSFATDGGAAGAITPSISDTIPANAIVVGGSCNSPTAVTSGGSATISIGTTAGSGAASILAATGKASFSLDAVIELIGFNSQAATQKAPFKMTAAGQINITVATAALTAGVLEIFVVGYVATNP